MVFKFEKSKHIFRYTTCMHFKTGKLGILVKRMGRRTYARRPLLKHCQKLNAPHALSPVFAAGSGSASIPLRKQAAVLHAAVWGHKACLVPTLFDDVGNKMVGHMYCRRRLQELHGLIMNYYELLRIIMNY